MGAVKQRLPVRLRQRLNQIAPGATAKGRPDKAQKPGNHRDIQPRDSRYPRKTLHHQSLTLIENRQSPPDWHAPPHRPRAKPGTGVKKNSHPCR
jgi:hypothetical protein